MPRRSPPTTPPKQIRRKSSFIRRVDSSEESPSPHGSIFEALYQSTTNSDESGNVDSWPTRHFPIFNQPAAHLSGTRENDENTRQQPAATNTVAANDSQFLYGRGTVLETITERTSLGSIRILARAKSADDLHIVPLKDSQSIFTRGKRPQRKKSLSLDDLNLIKDSCQQDTALEERESQTSLAIHEIYAQPKTPIKEPPGRPQTPPGMPSWTEHQLRPPQLRQGRRTSIGLRQLFCIGSSKAEPPREQCPPNGRRSVSAPVGGRAPRIARYRPPKSAYSRIDQHPFNSAPVAVVDPFLQHISARPTGKRKSVRFTPSTAARDSEAVCLQGRVASPAPPTSHPIAQLEPITPIQSTSSRPATPPRRRECPHRKGQRTAFKRLKHSSSTIPGIDYQAILSSPLTRDASHASLPRLPPPSPIMSSGWSGRSVNNWDFGIMDTEPISGAASNSSTTHLMTGALLAPSPSPARGSSHPDEFALPHSTKNSECWRCKLETLGDKLAKLRKKSSGCFWVVCCGFDPDEEGTTYPPRNVRMELGAQVTELSGGGRPGDRWWGRAERSLDPARTMAFDNSHFRIL